MLKIRDDVDLKELEKFGFKEIKTSNGNIYYFQITKNYAEYVHITIYNDRYITLDVNYEDYFTEDIDIFYDLIQAGLIEKVVEE